MEKNNYKTVLVEGENLVEGYHEALKALDEYGKIVDCDAYSNKYKTVVQKDIKMVIDILDVNKEPIISKFFLGGPDELQDYELEFVYGTRDFCVEAYEKGLAPNFWPYTYHERIIESEQIDFIIEELIKNKESRRAVIQVRDKDVDMHVSDPACLQQLFFNIRDNKLNMSVTMRSNDATQASGMNMYAFIKFQKMLALKLRQRAKEYIEIFTSFKEEDNEDIYREMIEYLKPFETIEAKGYTHFAHSFHAYGQLVSKEEFEKYLKENENKTLDEALKEGSVTKYKDGYVIGQIRSLHKNVQRIKNASVTNLSYPYESQNGFGYKEEMEKRICPYLAELVIGSSKKYGLFDEKIVAIIEDVLSDYNKSYEELSLACEKRNINLEDEYYALGINGRVKTKK